MMEPTKTSPLFDQWWAELPTAMRKDKVKAFEIWGNIFNPEPDLFLLDKMKAAIRKMMKTKRVQAGIVCNAPTYLIGRRWEDEIDDSELTEEVQEEKRAFNKVPRGSCPRCKGTGLVHIRQNQEHLGVVQERRSVARCNCKNAGNWSEAIPCITVVEKWTNYGGDVE